ncbi:hypothetical protein C1704_02255 [Caldimonas caldifontis]|uniref:Uncharacterized protein n=1 Tax=Caldimonas caldifontis TaxID=1452508 RepID=A0A2S5SYK0_9BURK|nr:hypothetical protein C1704_02255 [Caldimonas caldifontis]
MWRLDKAWNDPRVMAPKPTSRSHGIQGRPPASWAPSGGDVTIAATIASTRASTAKPNHMVLRMG